jgi:hypothetical protein
MKNIKPDITATIVFHQERDLVVSALASFEKMVAVARSAGLKVETQAILDMADAQTNSLVSNFRTSFSSVHAVTFGDLGQTRNAGVQSSSGEFLAFFDGDDLWGEDWLLAAFYAATDKNAAVDSIWHPQRLFYFDENDFFCQSINKTASVNARSFHKVHVASNAEGFDRRSLLLNNVWTANVFCKREFHIKHPYKSVDRSIGFGVEDWSWNLETLWGGIEHLVVPDTIHFIRQKGENSLGKKNTSEGLLPFLPENFQKHHF